MVPLKITYQDGAEGSIWPTDYLESLDTMFEMCLYILNHSTHGPSHEMVLLVSQQFKQLTAVLDLVCTNKTIR